MEQPRSGFRNGALILMLNLMAVTPAIVNGQPDTAVTFPVVVEAGHLFLRGRQLDLPLVFEHLGGESLSVNGLLICPREGRSPRDTTWTNELRHLQSLKVAEAWQLARELHLRGWEERRMLDSVAVFLDKYPELFDSARASEEYGLWVWPKNMPWPSSILLQSLDGAPEPPSPDEIHLEIVREWRSTLRSGGAIVIWECNGATLVPSGRVSSLLAEIEAASAMSLEEVSAYQFRYLKPQAAVQFASSGSR